jgi:hypothetical protein
MDKRYEWTPEKEFYIKRHFLCSCNYQDADPGCFVHWPIDEEDSAKTSPLTDKVKR